MVRDPETLTRRPRTGAPTVTVPAEFAALHGIALLALVQRRQYDDALGAMARDDPLTGAARRERVARAYRRACAELDAYRVEFEAALRAEGERLRGAQAGLLPAFERWTGDAAAMRAARAVFAHPPPPEPGP
jgi:hypothetical protein